MPSTTGSDVTGILSDLISFKTVSGHTEPVAACFDYLAEFLSTQKLQVTRLSSDGFPSIFASSQGTKTPHVLLQAHIDVVPAKDALFAMSEKDGKLYGRGVFDMKFAAACYLQLVQDLKEELSDYDFGIMLSSDEEVGGENGVSYMLEQGYGATICLLPDGGDNWQIEATCNAVWIVRVRASGKNAHGSRPWEGVNAINNLVEGLSDIHTNFDKLGPGKNSITISSIQGGSAMNQVPDTATATLDMRFINDQEYTKYAQAIRKTAQAKGLELETLVLVKARNVDVTQPGVHSFLSIAAAVHGKPLTKTHSLGASDACYFAKHGIPTIVLRPNGGGQHSDHEWIDKAELLKFYELIKTYVITSAKVS